MKHQSIFNWSGGKDSSLALYHILQQGDFEIGTLLTSVNQAFGRISMHGVREELLERQAELLDLPLHKLYVPEQPTMSEYETLMRAALDGFVADGYTHSIFGDIFLEDLKDYREQKLAEVNLKGHFPLWKRDTKELLQEFLDLGFKTVIVCCKAELLDESFAGRIIDQSFIDDLPEGVDVCGENGEFHTFVFDGPIFKEPIPIKIGETIHRGSTAPKDANDVCGNAEDQSKQMGFWFTDILLDK